MARSYMSAVKKTDGTVRNIEVMAKREKDAHSLVAQAIADMWPDEKNLWTIETVARLKKNGTPVREIARSTLGEVTVYNKELRRCSRKYKRDKPPVTQEVKSDPSAAKKIEKLSSAPYVVGWSTIKLAAHDAVLPDHILHTLIETDEAYCYDTDINRFPLVLTVKEDDPE